MCQCSLQLVQGLLLDLRLLGGRRLQALHVLVETGPFFDEAALELRLELVPLGLGRRLLLGNLSDPGLAAAQVVDDPLHLARQASATTRPRLGLLARLSSLPAGPSLTGKYHVLVRRERPFLLGLLGLVLVLALSPRFRGLGSSLGPSPTRVGVRVVAPFFVGPCWSLAAHGGRWHTMAS